MRPFAPRRRNEFHKAPPFLYTVAVFLVVEKKERQLCRSFQKKDQFSSVMAKKR
ncbi:hypothetical protein TGS27_1516 [Geobacillus stearothermophilus]|uniref:Uncharacterized protein n=1 Tax=Geobacillus stearothermophilus TaxID=1422 RepID=A0A150NEK8_GEOSE|nr:hypothetical protein B4114_1430 [Geobacillus stearothermophilus]OAO81872.1 hypothetical protein TGS27_1516 [Geobacillus stearothermophilus]